MTGESVLLVAEGQTRFPGIIRIGAPENAEPILGHESMSMKIWFDDDAEATYRWSNDFAIDPRWFTEYRIAGFDAYYDKSRAVILGYERRTPVLRRREIATHIVTRQVTDAELAILDLPIVPIESMYSE